MNYEICIQLSPTRICLGRKRKECKENRRSGVQSKQYSKFLLGAKFGKKKEPRTKLTKFIEFQTHMPCTLATVSSACFKCLAHTGTPPHIHTLTHTPTVAYTLPAASFCIWVVLWHTWRMRNCLSVRPSVHLSSYSCLCGMTRCEIR